MSPRASQPGPIALVSVGICLASLFAVVVFALPPRRAAAPAAQPQPAPEVVAPDAPLDPQAFAKLKDELGHKPFSGTVFEAEAQTQSPAPAALAETDCVGPKASLLKAAHLLDQAAYALEQANLFERAEGLRAQAGELRVEAKQRHADGEPSAEPTPAGGGRNRAGRGAFVERARIARRGSKWRAGAPCG